MEFCDRKEASLHLQTVLQLIDKALPSGIRLRLLCKSELFTQLLHRGNPTKYIGKKAANAIEFREAASAYIFLSRIFFSEQKKKLQVFCTLRALNLVELAGIMYDSLSNT